MLTRRTFVAGTAALAALPRIPLARADAAPAFVACCRRPDGDFEAAVIDADGAVLFTAALDARCHDAAVDPERSRAVVFARRPGRFAVVIDLAARARTMAFAPPDGRLFAGHGAFVAGGRLLMATEEDYDGERGVIGVYDATDGFRRVGEFASGGVGPHEAMLLSDGRTLAVANGGILNHPDFPRLPLNLATMAPSFALIDTATGEVRANAVLPAALHQLSIRHAVEAPDGSVWFGGQYLGPSTDCVPLIGRFDRERGLSLIEADEAVWRLMAQYVGAVALSRDGTRVAASCPRGGAVVTFDVATGAVADVTRIVDACGIAGAGAGFAITDGAGEIVLPGGRVARASAQWDNHLRAVG